MARTPKELLERLTADDQKEAARLEQLIDAKLDAEYKGEREFRVWLDRKPSPRVLLELTCRYAAWVLSLQSVPERQDVDYYLILSPRPQRPCASCMTCGDRRRVTNVARDGSMLSAPCPRCTKVEG